MPYSKKFFSWAWICVALFLFVIDIICGVLSVYLLIWYGFDAWANKSFFSITYKRMLMQEFGITVMVMPVATIYWVHFGLFYLINFIMLRINISFKSIQKLYAVLATEFIILELMAAVYLGYAFSVVYNINQYLALCLCISYPIVIGTIKKLQEKFIKEFHIEEIFEFMALNVAAFPYRFIYLSIDSPLPAAGVLIIKFTYKSLSYIVVWIPKIRKILKRLKQLKSSVTAKLNPCKKRKESQAIVDCKNSKKVQSNIESNLQNRESVI